MTPREPEKGALLVRTFPGWAEHTFRNLLPGAHVVVFGPYSVGLEARRAGFEVRDSFLVLGLSSLHAFLFRHPVEGTVAENVLRYGVGALNIGACRVHHIEPAKMTERTVGKFSDSASAYAKDTYSVQMQSGSLASPSILGRWPPNLLLVHGPGCKEVGTRQYQGDMHVPSTRTLRGIYGNGKGDVQKGQKVQNPTKADRVETIPFWNCQDGCPVLVLDEQSSFSSSHGHGGFRSPLGYKGGCLGHGLVRQVPQDFGGASRFFPQFKDEAALLDWLRLLIGV